ncbi:MAG TPA: hypothetical protein DCG10_08010 [Lachnospiraceae bacterium]|nr:hypothetical protein [Lachnospiraceae bacterium]
MAKKKVEKNNTINIKSQPVQAHIGAARFANDDWGTIAFSFPRTDLSLKFIDKELRYNSIYFLFGYEDGHEVAYVGQALKRKNGESALVRLREHDKSTTEPYRDKWSWIIVVTNKDDTWGATELNALESIFIQEVPEKNNLNGRGQNNGGADISLYEDKVTQIKALITAIGFKIFEDIPEKENIQVISEVNEYSIVEDLQNGMARIPEIVTPDKVVKAMVDMLPAEVWNSKTKFLDPACKGGEYLREIYDRLMENATMQSAFPNDIERSNHILKNQIYGIALSQVSLDRTTKKLFGEDRNIKIIPDYINKLKGINMGSRPDGKQNNIGDILNKEFGKDMEFDVVIGNPPYQKINGNVTEGSVASGESIYQLFFESATSISDIVCMITPAKWFAGNKKLDDMRKILLTGNHITKIGILDANKIFHIIMDKVSYFCWNKEYCGQTEIVDETNTQNNDTRFIANDRIDCFIVSKIDASIVKKVINDKSIEQYINSQNAFGLISKTRGFDKKTSEDDLIMHYTGYECQGDNICYIPKNWVSKHVEYIDKYKVLYPHGCGSKSNVLTRVIFAEKNEVCTQSYIVVGPVNTEESARRIEKYLKTKFVRALVRVRMIDQHMDKDRFRFVPVTPLNDSDIDWSQSISNIDQQLYKKYNLSDEEIAYIESTIKPME